MGVKATFRSSLNSLLKPFWNGLNSFLKLSGYNVIQSRLLYEWQKFPQTKPIYRNSRLPKEAKSYLQKSNPILKDLQDRYAAFDKEVTVPLVWTDAHVRPDDILYFRGDNAYVWQLRGNNMNIIAYALTTFYIKSIDKLGLLNTLKEDDFFGIFAFSIDNKLISRDLLDSILEIYFLEKHLNISVSKNLTILDIGAGYGRLAHRMLDALPNIAEYLCTDAFPISTFLSEYYLRFRNLEDKANVVPIDKIENTLKSKNINIAINIHSFPECKISAIEWWLSLLAKYNVKYLMIVPHSDTLRTIDGKDFGEIIKNYGYKLMAKDPKYSDPVVQEYAIMPTYHYLFELC